MSFYGYNPASPAFRRNTSAIRDVANIAGKTIMHVSEVKKAADLAKKNWSAMEDAYKSIVSAYRDEATPLVKNGVITEDDLENSLKVFPPPTTIHKKNPEGYLTILRSGWKNLSDNLSKKQQAAQQAQRSQAIGGAVSQQLTGSPATTETQPTGPERDVGGFTEQDITQVRRPEISPAETKEQAYGAVSQQQYPGGPVTTKEFEQYGGKYLPTGLDLLKQKTDEEHKRKMRARGYSNDAQEAELKKLKQIQQMRNSETSKLNRLESQKKSLVNIKKSLEKDGLFDQNDAAALKEYGVDAQDLQDQATANPEQVKQMIDEMILELDARTKVQKRNSQEVEKAYIDLLQEPGKDIFKTLREGRKEATGQMNLEAVQEAAGGLSGISGPPTSGLPQRGTGAPQTIPFPQDVPDTPMNQGIWDTIQQKVSEGRLSPMEATQYFREYINRKQ